MSPDETRRLAGRPWRVAARRPAVDEPGAGRTPRRGRRDTGDFHRSPDGGGRAGRAGVFACGGRSRRMFASFAVRSADRGDPEPGPRCAGGDPDGTAGGGGASALPDDENGAFAYLAAFEKMSAATPQEQAALEAMRDGTATPAQIEMLKGYLLRNAEAIALPESGRSLGALPLSRGLRIRIRRRSAASGESLERVEPAEAESLLQRREGGDDGSSRAALGRLADSLSGEPILVSQLVRYLVVEREAAAIPNRSGLSWRRPWGWKWPGRSGSP